LLYIDLDNMATGRFNTSQKLDIADQFHVVSDEHLRLHLIKMADYLDEAARVKVFNTYNDPELSSIYRGMRTFNDLNEKGFTDKKTMREIVRIPAGEVYEFLRAFFEPTYGQKWLRNKKVLKHELLRPWWIVSKI